MSNIVVFWDLMLDKFTYWEVKRLNPEWPNPLLNVLKEEYKLWWAANVAANLSSLNWEVNLVWILWKDSNWSIDQNWSFFKSICELENIEVNSILNISPTITKQRFIEFTYHQQMLRVDYENKFLLDYKDEDFLVKTIIELNPEILIISDYNKGTITGNIIKKVTKGINVKTKILVDSKPNNINLFKWTYLIKPNFKEFCQMIWKEIENEDEIIGKHWIDFVKYYSTNLVVTRWNKWATLVTKDFEVVHIPTEAQQVFDVTWAWDTFISTIAYWLSIWYSLIDSIKLGNKASWIVIWKVWTSLITKQELWI